MNHHVDLGVFNLQTLEKLSPDKAFTTTEWAVFVLIGNFLKQQSLCPSEAVKPFAQKKGAVWAISLSNKWILDRSVMFGTTSPQTIYRAVSGLERKGYLTTYTTRNANTGWMHKYYLLTEQGSSVLTPVVSSYDETDASDPPEKEEADKWEPSADLLVFLKKLKPICGSAYKYDVYKPNGDPMGYMKKTDDYIKQLISGEFVTKNSIEGNEIPKMTLDDIVQIASKVTLYTKGTHNIGEIFTTYNKTTSPFVSYYKQMHPDTIVYNEGHIADLLVKNPHIKDTIDEIHDSEVSSENKSVMEMCARMTDYFYDDVVLSGIAAVNKKHLTNINIDAKMVWCKWYFAAYKEYRDFFARKGKEPKYHTVDEWISATSIGNASAYGIWWRFIRYVYQQNHIWLTDAENVVDNIIDYETKARERSLGGENGY
jgi:hypothetical protein